MKLAQHVWGTKELSIQCFRGQFDCVHHRRRFSFFANRRERRTAGGERVAVTWIWRPGNAIAALQDKQPTTSRVLFRQPWGPHYWFITPKSFLLVSRLLTRITLITFWFSIYHTFKVSCNKPFVLHEAVTITYLNLF